MSAIVAGFNRGIAEVVGSFLRLPPLAVELQKLTGCRVRCDDRSCLVICSVEAAMAAWAAYDRVHVTVRQYIEIGGIRCWSEVDGGGVKWAGEPFPFRRRSTHQRYGGRVAIIDAVYHALVYVSADRAWEHRRLLAGADLEDLEEPRGPGGEPPVAHGRVAPLIEELQAESDDEI